jgi:hypothetical protein
MTPIQARAKLVELLTEVNELAPALRALDLWEAVIQVVPRRKVVATIDVDSFLNDTWWIKDRLYCLREDAREVERARFLEMCRADAVAYGEFHHLDLEVRDSAEDVAGDVGAEIWHWGHTTPALEPAPDPIRGEGYFTYLVTSEELSSHRPAGPCTEGGESPVLIGCGASATRATWRRSASMEGRRG